MLQHAKQRTRIHTGAEKETIDCAKSENRHGAGERQHQVCGWVKWPIDEHFRQTANTYVHICGKSKKQKKNTKRYRKDAQSNSMEQAQI